MRRAAAAGARLRSNKRRKTACGAAIACRGAKESVHTDCIEREVICMKRMFLLLCALLLLPALCFAEAVDIGVLVPMAHEAQAGGEPVALYCAPTQGAYRHDELTIDLGEPYVCFGQYDCWAMVAAGTPDAMGPAGWVETAALDIEQGSELSFSDAYQEMVEDDTFLTDEPWAGEPAQLMSLPRGTIVTLLAQYEGWGYVQCEIDGIFVRGFLPLEAIL